MLDAAAFAPDNERRALLAAGAAHLVLILGLSLAWSMPDKPQPAAPETTPVEIVSIGALPRVPALPVPAPATPPQAAAVASPAPADEMAAIDVDPVPMLAPEPLLVPPPVLPLHEPQHTAAKPHEPLQRRAQPKPVPAKRVEPKPAPAAAAEPEPAAAKSAATKPASTKPAPAATDAERMSPKAVDAQPAPAKPEPRAPARPEQKPVATAPQTARSAPTPTPTPTPASAKPQPHAAAQTSSKTDRQAAQRLDTQQLSKLLDQSQPKAERKRLDVSDLATTLDKATPKAARRDAAASPPERKPLDVSGLASTLENAVPRSAKLDAQGAAALAKAIQAQIYPCWNPPQATGAQERSAAVLHIALAPDGSVRGAPRVVRTTGSDPSYTRLLAESARRAVLRCAPLKLPADLYEAWSEVELNFDPQQLD